LRKEVKAQLEGSGDDRVVGLRNRLDETDDWAVADSLAELDIAGLRHALKDLAEVDAALGRMRDGSYGVCIDCAEEIAPARLSAYPTATRCLECQQTYEARPGRA
jgi:DnaK suppressor protein